jgi:hypothetical protein
MRSQAGFTVLWPCVAGFDINSVPKSGLYYEISYYDFTGVNLHVGVQNQTT